jgi:hypothetical protein
VLLMGHPHAQPHACTHCHIGACTFDRDAGSESILTKLDSCVGRSLTPTNWTLATSRWTLVRTKGVRVQTEQVLSTGLLGPY